MYVRAPEISSVYGHIEIIVLTRDWLSSSEGVTGNLESNLDVQAGLFRTQDGATQHRVGYILETCNCVGLQWPCLSFHGGAHGRICVINRPVAVFSWLTGSSASPTGVRTPHKGSTAAASIDSAIQSVLVLDGR